LAGRADAPLQGIWSSSMSWFDRLIKRKQPQAYRNPIDGRTYVAEGGWTQYSPQTAHRSAAPGPVRLDHVRLLSPQELVATNVTVDALTRFMKNIEAHVAAQLQDSAVSFEALIQYTLSSDQAPQLHMAARGDVPREQLQQLHNALTLVEPLRTREDPITFQMHFVVDVSVR
jgi:hypothetical protein